MSDYKMIDLVSRDQTPTQEALDGFKQFINRFPKSQFLEDAKKKLKEAMDAGDIDAQVAANQDLARLAIEAERHKATEAKRARPIPMAP